MGEEKQPKPPTPEQQVEQQQQNDEKDIHGRFAATDMMERASNLVEGLFGGGPGGSLFGTSNFEKASLNDMLNLLDSANPADLENAGDSLEKANTALKAAAKELAASVKAIDWQGEGAEQFRAYGSQLVTYTYGLSTFANAVGAQMKVASTGLASVRNSKPPRDGRVVQKKPDDFALPERTQDNPEYQKALAVEKDRQEAINQMNRLASFYAVSATTLAAQDPPPMPKPVNAAVPRPLGRRKPTGGDPSAAAAAQAGFSGVASPPPGPSAVGAGGTGGVGDGPSRTDVLATPVASVAPSTSMEIDSVTATAPPVSPSTSLPPSPTANPGPTTSTAPPVMTNFGTPPRGPAQSAGTRGLPRPGSGPSTTGPVGRPSASGGGGSSQVGRASGGAGRPAPPAGPVTSAGRAGMPAGRPGPMGAQPGVSRPGVVGGAGQNPVAGRPGMAGQPAVGRQGASNAPRTGPSNGIVGGTPQRTTNGPTGSRIPKATVIGGESTPTGRSSAARPSQSGVIGAPQPSGAPRPTGRGTPSTNGVVGTARPGAGGSPGGSVGRGARPGQRQSGDGQESPDPARPGYATEDQDTWAARRRATSPPVID
ncbi:hypothetical protein ACQI4E_21165 [Streptomyces sp. CA-252508]|uniref:hypothetical protein n=1 Tax=Streptomyces sp. CA-252508 TaxID=3418946 RepID=UPI003D8F7DB9